MKIRKLFAAILCVVLACFALSACAEEDVKEHAGEELDRYYESYKPEVIVDLHYNLYIISENDDSMDASMSEATVQAKINQYLSEKFNTVVTIHYLTASEYMDTVNGVISSLDNAAGTTNSAINGGNIVLVAGKGMYDSFMEQGALVDLRSYLNTNAYGKLNTQITSTLLESAKVKDNGEEMLFFVPNNHIIGEYTYTVIDRAVAEGKLSFSAQTELHEMIIKDGVANDIAKELINAVEKLPDTEVTDVIREVKGSYSDKALYEAQGYICNVSSYPVVTPEETFAAGFAVLTPPVYDYDLDEDAETTNDDFLTGRAMDVIYSINTEAEIKNLLQYGVEYTNFTLESVTVKDASGKDIKVEYVVPMEGNAYKMNSLYTGDMFKAYYSEEDIWTIGENTGSWTYDFVLSGSKQNLESVIEE